MKERGKSVQDYNNFNTEYNYYSSDLPCKKHPSNSSSVGICAYCLKDRLMRLVCSDCGEQRLSSCSCSDVSSYRNSSCTVDVGSVGRISFLIENEKGSYGDEQKTETLLSHMRQPKKTETEDLVLLKRSNSCAVEAKRGNGLWRIGKYFKKKREKVGCGEGNRDGSDCVMNVSRSRSLCSFRGGHLDHEVGDMGFSSAKVSDFHESEPRKSGLRGGFMDDDSGFIDLKLDFSDKMKCDPLDFGRLKGDMFVGSQRCPENMGASCRITVNDRGIKKGRNGHGKVWKWIFKHHSGKKDLNHILKS